jgi:hypothetical protein
MSDFKLFRNIDIKKCIDSKNPVSASIEAARNSGGIIGSILNKAFDTSGSDGEMFKDAIDYYANHYNPIFIKLFEAMGDPTVKKEVSEKLIARHKTSKLITKPKNDKD